MAKKKELTGESFTVRSYGTGWTVNGTRYYEGDEKNENFEEVYADRMKLIEGLAKYLGLETTRLINSDIAQPGRETVCVFKPKPEKST